ncbi:MAG TPA: M43 family zinc metalloprotease [Bacteroidia bacterium]|nr:M43 family zinc metalloprotease [Bacteroidia bacterium]
MKKNCSKPALLLLIVFAFISTNKVTAQKWCGSDSVWKVQTALHPDIWQRAEDLEKFTQQFIQQYRNHKATGTGTDTITYIIPIVFHILHSYGPENISDAQVFDEMRILNEDYARLNPDTNVIATPHFKKIAANTKIQWRLAQIDPNGNCTNGIDRIYTSLTNNADDNAKLNQWDPTKYVNVWVCKSIYQGGGVASGGTVLGYAYFPSEIGPYNFQYDGVLINYQAIGSIGTAYNGPGGSWSRCLSHELGHVLNLEHPWGLTNSPGVACGDDGVGDTPYTKGWFSICPSDSNGAKICDTVTKKPLFIVTENWQNFMDYSFCSRMFTMGQAERMWGALNTTMAGRNNLWSKSNLIATGVDTTLAVLAEDSATIEQRCVPKADFSADYCMVCQGATVQYTDASWNAEPTSWNWKFTGANINSSTLKDPAVTYDSLWYQTVSLTAADAAGSTTTTKGSYVYVSPLWTTYSAADFSDGFENKKNFDWIILNKANDRTQWQVTSSAAYSGSYSLFLNSYAPTVYANTNPPSVIYQAVKEGNTDDAITPAMSFAYVSSPVLTFEYSCATVATASVALTESLSIAYSLNCGQTWTIVSTITGAALTNMGYWNTSFIPGSSSDWVQATVPLPSGLTGKSNVRLRFEYTSGVSSNNIYIDNVNISGVLGINEISGESYNAIIYPNPTKGDATLSYTLLKKQHIIIQVSNVLGQQITEGLDEDQAPGKHIVNIPSQSLPGGVYFVKITADNNLVAVRKLIVEK